MLKWIMFFSLILSFGNVEAHQPDRSSTLLVEQGENKWILQVRAALTAFEYEIHQHFGKTSYTTPEEFQELVVKHLGNNISVLFNEDNSAILQNGMVKLGHETSVTFEVVGTPETLKYLTVKNSGFGDISRNESALIIVKKGFSKDQFVLNNNNGHTAELKVADSKFELLSPVQKQEQSQYLFLILAGVLFLFVLTYFVIRKRNKTELSPIFLKS